MVFYWLHIYMVFQNIYCAWLSTITHRNQPLSPIHKTSINARALALRSLPWFHTIFTSCTIKIPWVQNRGVTFPFPFNNTVLSSLQKFNNCYTGTALSTLQIWTKKDVPIFIFTFIFRISWSRSLPSPCLHASTHATRYFPGLIESFSSAWNISNVFGI